MFSRLNTRTKLIAVGILAFAFGMMLKGGGGENGRYMPCGSSPQYLIDTQKGIAWQMQGSSYRRVASVPWGG